MFIGFFKISSLFWEGWHMLNRLDWIFGLFFILCSLPLRMDNFFCFLFFFVRLKIILDFLMYVFLVIVFLNSCLDLSDNSFRCLSNGSWDSLIVSNYRVRSFSSLLRILIESLIFFVFYFLGIFLDSFYRDFFMKFPLFELLIKWSLLILCQLVFPSVYVDLNSIQRQVKNQICLIYRHFALEASLIPNLGVTMLSNAFVAEWVAA